MFVLLVRLEFYRGIFGEEKGDDAMEKHKHVIHISIHITDSVTTYGHGETIGRILG